MRDEMLFIDGELVDLDEDTKITLNIKSNLFTDLSKIVSNNSYTIKLPKTVRNQRIIEHADLPACNTDYSRKYHNGRYFRNGIEIIPNAKVVLISVGEKIELAMTWGNYVALSNIIEGDKLLTDLPEISGDNASEGRDYVEWKKLAVHNTTFPKVDYGFNEEETSVWYHPALSVKNIIERITKNTGVAFIFPEEKQEVIDKLIVPLLTRNESEEYAEMCSVTLAVTGSIKDDQVNQYTLYFEDSLHSNYYGRMAANTTYTSYITNGKPRLSGDFSVIVQSQSTPSSVVLNVHKANTDNQGANIELDTILEIEPVDIQKVDENNLYRIVFSFKDVETSSLLDNKFGGHMSSMRFSFANLDGSTVSAEGSFKIMNIAEKVLIIRKTGTGAWGDTYTDGRFWLVPNLPDIKQIDFLKAIASILGLFVVSGLDDSIIFVSVDTLISNKDIAKDWTKKVIAEYVDNKPKSIEFVLDGFYQRNNYKWKEDDSVLGNYDSYLEVDNETIDYEDDVVVLPFAATDTPMVLPKIPLYSYDEQGNIEYSTVEPRILKLDGINGSFKNMDWETILKENYSSFQNIIRKPIIIKEKIEISDIELREIDVTIPVYLAQYGRYYAIISIKAENTGICECELLQLEV